MRVRLEKEAREKEKALEEQRKREAEEKARYKAIPLMPHLAAGPLTKIRVSRAAPRLLATALRWRRGAYRWARSSP